MVPGIFFGWHKKGMIHAKIAYHRSRCTPSSDLSRNQLRRYGRSNIFVESLETATEKSGDLLMAVGEGALELSDVRGGLGALIVGHVPGCQDDGEIAMFNSVGIGMQDLAISRLIYDAAQQEGWGCLPIWLHGIGTASGKASPSRHPWTNSGSSSCARTSMPRLRAIPSPHLRASFQRSAVEALDWRKSGPTAALLTGQDAHLKRTGVAHDVVAIDLTEHPGLAELMASFRPPVLS